MSKFLLTLLRQPLAVLGAIGILSMLKGLITIHEDVLLLVTAYQSMTQPIWDYSVGWLLSQIGIPFPSWAKDYLTMGVIVLMADYRRTSFYYDNSRADAESEPWSMGSVVYTLFGRWRWVKRSLGHVFLWPITILLALKSYWNRAEHRTRIEERVRKENWLVMDELQQMAAGVPGADQRLVEKQAAIADRFAGSKERSTVVFFEFILWTFALLALSYGLTLNQA